MRVKATVLATVLAALPLGLSAQLDSGSAALNEALEMVRTMAQVERKAIVISELRLTDEQSARFIDLYDEYLADMDAVEDRLLQLVLDYAENYDSMTNEFATGMVDDYLEIEMDTIKVRNRYARRLDDVLTPVQLARFIQMENKLTVLRDLDLAKSIPLIP